MPLCQYDLGTRADQVDQIGEIPFERRFLLFYQRK